MRIWDAEPDESEPPSECDPSLDMVAEPSGPLDERDDFELGQARTTIRYRYPSESYVNGAATYSYDQAAATADGQPTAPPPPPPNPSPPKPEPLKMQSFMGSDMETAYDQLRVHKDTLAYCCSGVYTQMDSEGAS